MSTRWQQRKQPIVTWSATGQRIVSQLLSVQKSLNCRNSVQSAAPDTPHCPLASAATEAYGRCHFPTPAYSLIVSCTGCWSNTGHDQLCRFTYNKPKFSRSSCNVYQTRSPRNFHAVFCDISMSLPASIRLLALY